MLLERPLIRYVILAIAVLYCVVAALGLRQLQIAAAAPFFITPVVQGNDLLDGEQNRRLLALLDGLEPGGAKGHVRLGYSFALNLYDYFQDKNGIWVVDSGQIDRIVERIIALKRPAVIGFIANHFAGNGAYAQFLLKNPDAVMRYADGSAVNERYFRHFLAPFTLSTDGKLPHVRAMRAALEVMAKAFARLEKAHPELVVAYTFNGETHELFEDFFGGTGRFERARFTDFSDGALHDFHVWLAAHPGSAINEAPEQVRTLAPSAYEWGTYPLFGWYCPATAGQQLVLLKDGVATARTVPSLNRLDVYEAVPEINDPNCGFRFDVDFSDWPPGTYDLQVVVESNGSRYALENGHRLLRVGKAPRRETSAVPPPLASLPPALGRGYVDHGDATPVNVRYRPLVRAWMEWRAAQIVHRVDWMAEPFRAAGFPSAKLYNYQIPPWMNGDWNETQFGVGRDFFTQSRLMPGVTLYGGNTRNDELLGYLPPGKPYGMPEFHTQMGKSKGAALAAMRFHQKHGARFLSPYFMNIDSKQRSPSSHDLMLIAPENHQRGSDDMYEAIREMVKH